MLFLGAFSAIIFAYIIFHALAYYSAVHFFEVTNSTPRRVLISVLLFLGSSFIIAMFLVHWRDAFITRTYYLFSGSWIGFLINLVMFFALGWILAGILSWLDISFEKRIIGIIVICAAAAYSLYGIWNAFSPTIKNLEIKIENLPNEWKGKKIVQISDVHLGHVYREKYMENVAQKINALKPDAIFIVGDLFDGMDSALDIFSEPLGKLYATDGIYYVTGNHETYLGIDNAISVIDKTNIKLLRNEMAVVDGLQIIGIDYPRGVESKNIGAVIKSLPEFDSKKSSILLWHMPTQIEVAKEVGISLQLSGHTHKGQLFPLGAITSLVYKGFDYGLKQDGQFSIYTTSGLGAWGPPMRTQKRSEIVEITLR